MVEPRGPKGTRLTSAAAWLREHMTAVGGEVKAGVVYAAAEQAGHHPRTLNRALPLAGVELVPGTHRWRLVDRRCPHCGGVLP